MITRKWWEKENPYEGGIPHPKLEVADDFVTAILCNEPKLINFCLREAQRSPTLLESVIHRLSTIERPPLETRIAFHRAWITSGLRLRESFAIDSLIPGLLSNLLPGYVGPSLVLFRGERWSNHRDRTYGPSWTSKKSVGEMFAAGLNRENIHGGVLLRTVAPGNAILAGPAAYGHMSEESEYIVDRRLVGDVEVIERYPVDEDTAPQRG